MYLLILVFAHSVTSHRHGVLITENIPPLHSGESWTSSTAIPGAESLHTSSRNKEPSDTGAVIGHKKAHSCCSGSAVHHGLNSTPVVDVVKSGTSMSPNHVDSAYRLHTDSARFLAEERLNALESQATKQTVKAVSAAEAPVAASPALGDSNSTAPPSVSVTENDSLDNYHREVAQGKLEEIGGVENVDVDANLEKASNDSTSLSPMPSNSTHENENTEQGTGTSWLDLITSPLAKKAFKYVATEFYPKKILDKLSKWKISNSTKIKNGGPDINLTPSVVYPLVMEGVSILANQLTDNGWNSDDQEESEPVVKGPIVQGVIESLNTILKPKKSDQNLTGSTDKPEEIRSPGKDVLNSGILDQLLPLLETIPTEDLQEAVDGLMDVIMNSTSLHSLSNASEIDIPGLLSQPRVLSVILRNRDKFSSLPGFQNSSVLSEILKKPGVLSAIMKNKSRLPDMGNLTNIMSQFLPKHDAGDGMSPKNPLMRSDFVSKLLAKSPVAHLGALDENVIRLISNSLEKTASRFNINEKGEFQMDEGMRKMLGKMMNLGKLGQNRTDGSLMGVVESAVESGSDNLESSKPPEDVRPVVRRNITRHSPLHQKFQQKYGKYYQKSSAEPFGSSFIVISVLPVIITVFFT